MQLRHECPRRKYFVQQGKSVNRMDYQDGQRGPSGGSMQIDRIIKPAKEAVSYMDEIVVEIAEMKPEYNEERSFNQ